MRLKMRISVSFCNHEQNTIARAPKVWQLATKCGVAQKLMEPKTDKMLMSLIPLGETRLQADTRRESLGGQAPN